MVVLGLSSAGAGEKKPGFVYTLPIEIKLSVETQGTLKKMGSLSANLVANQGLDSGNLVFDGLKLPVHITSLMLAEEGYCTPTITALMWANDPEAVPVTDAHLGRYHPHLSFELNIADLKTLAEHANKAWYRNKSTQSKATAIISRLMGPARPHDTSVRLNGADWCLFGCAYLERLQFWSAPDRGCNYNTKNNFRIQSGPRDQEDGVTMEVNTSETGTLSEVQP